MNNPVGGTICDLSKYKGKTWCVQLDSGEKLYLDEEIVYLHALRAGMSLNDEMLEQILYQSNLHRCRERALYLLSYREHSSKELTDKLLRGYDADIAQQVVDKMEEIGLLDDMRYGRTLAKSLIEHKKFGLQRASYEMRNKGLDRELIEELLAPYEEQDPRDAIREIVQRKYVRYLGDLKGNQKVIGALARMGYRYDDIKAVIRDYMEEEEDY